MNGRRVQKVQKVQRGGCPAPAGLEVMAPKGETTHYILRVAGAPSKCVRCAPPAAAGCIERLCSLPLRGKVAAPPQFIAPFPRKGVAPEDRGVSSFLIFFGPILSPIGQLLPEEGACVTGIPFVSPVLHDEEPKPSSSGRRCRRRRRMIEAFRRKAEALKGPDVTLHKKPPVAAPLLKKGLSSARQIS